MNRTCPAIPATSRVVPLLLLLSMAACSSVQTAGDPAFEAYPGDRYAWSAPAFSGAGLPYHEFQAAIDDELAARGLRQAVDADADLLVRPVLGVEAKTRYNDPYFELYIADRYEEGTLGIQVLDARTASLVWSAETHLRLRFTERSMGGVSTMRWTPTGDERQWHIPDVAERLFQRFPLGDADGREPDAPTDTDA